MADTDTESAPPIYTFWSSSKRFKHITAGLESTNDETLVELKKELPGLATLLRGITSEDDDVFREQSVQQLLDVFYRSPDNSNELILERYTSEEQQAIRKFADGTPAGELAKTFQPGVSPGAREELPLIVPFANTGDGALPDDVQCDESACQDMSGEVAYEEVKPEFEGDLEGGEQRTPGYDVGSQGLRLPWIRKKTPPTSQVRLYNDVGKNVEINAWSNAKFENWG